MDYRRYYYPGGTYFFTLVTFNRIPFFAERDSAIILREIFESVNIIHPFKTDALVILPDHLHFIWTLPEQDADYPTRIRLIKTRFTNYFPASTKNLSPSRKAKGEHSVWQRRYWEHFIRDEMDYQHHVEYIHFNPVKHGLVNSVIDWPYSSFPDYVIKGLYPKEWGADTRLRRNIYLEGE